MFIDMIGRISVRVLIFCMFTAKYVLMFIYFSVSALRAKVSSVFLTSSLFLGEWYFVAWFVGCNQ